MRTHFYLLIQNMKYPTNAERRSVKTCNWILFVMFGTRHLICGTRGYIFQDAWLFYIISVVHIFIIRGILWMARIPHILYKTIQKNALISVLSIVKRKQMSSIQVHFLFKIEKNNIFVSTFFYSVDLYNVYYNWNNDT